MSYNVYAGQSSRPEGCINYHNGTRTELYNGRERSDGISYLAVTVYNGIEHPGMDDERECYAVMAEVTYHGWRARRWYYIDIMDEPLQLPAYYANKVIEYARTEWQKDPPFSAIFDAGYEQKEGF